MRIELFRNVKVEGKIIKAGICTVDDDIAEMLIEEGHAEELCGSDEHFDESDLNPGGNNQELDQKKAEDDQSEAEEDSQTEAKEPEKSPGNQKKKKSKGG